MFLEAALNDPLPALIGLFETAVRAASYFPDLGRHLPDDVRGRVLVLGAGKASGALAAALEPALLDRYGADRVSGVVVVPDGTPEPVLSHLQTTRASHPIPDARSRAAAEQALRLAATLGPDDLLVGLFSGGGSALLSAPAPGLSAEDKTSALRVLHDAGLPIGDLNRVRMRLSAIKGGRLALAASPARVLNLIVSDIPGDDPILVASGPTVGSPESDDDLLDRLAGVLARLPSTVRARLLQVATPPAPYPAIVTHVVSRPSQALAAAAEQARSFGWEVVDLGAEVQGDARAVASDHAVLLHRLIRSASAVMRPKLLLSGGETSAEVRGAGRGGRNTEYLLALALAMDPWPVHGIAADTDGIDGTGPHAGAVLTPDTLTAARAGGRDPDRDLERSDSAGAFEAARGLVTTGPTGTNVNDFRAVLLDVGRWQGAGPG